MKKESTFTVTLEDNTDVEVVLTFISEEMSANSSIIEEFESGSYEADTEYDPSGLSAGQIAEVEALIADNFDEWVDEIVYGEDSEEDLDE
jgi:hypothetical protein